MQDLDGNKMEKKPIKSKAVCPFSSQIQRREATANPSRVIRNEIL